MRLDTSALGIMRKQEIGDDETIPPKGLYPPQMWRKSVEEQIELVSGDQ